MGTRRRNLVLLNVLMHRNDFHKEIFWYHPNPWALFMLRKYDDNVYKLTGEFCSTADVKDWNDFLIVRAEGDLRKVERSAGLFALPLGKKDCKLLRIFKPATRQSFPSYLNLNESLISLRTRYPNGDYGSI